METVRPVISDSEVRANFARLFSIPYSREALGTAWVAFFITLYNVSVSGKIQALAIMLGFALCSLLYYPEIFYFLTRNKKVVLYPILALISSIWSSVSSLSLWYGFQLSVTVATAIFMGIIATPRQIVRGVFISVAFIIIASVISGRKGPSAIGPVLIGITGSKSIIAGCGVLLVGAGVAILFDRKQPLVLRLLSLPLTPVGFYYALHVDSASSKITVLALPIATLGFLALRYFSHTVRWALVGLALVFTISVTLVIVGTTDLTKNLDQKVLSSLHKDRTLTGRTVMWAKADAWIEKSPVIGHGYRAFWSSGSSDSMGILHSQGLTDFRGFQLHNTVREIRVDTGWIGAIVFFGTAAFFLYKTLAFAFLYPSSGSAFLAALYLMTLSIVPTATIIGIFYSPTAQFYLCGTAAIVFLMNRQNEISSVSSINTLASNDYETTNDA